MIYDDIGRAIARLVGDPGLFWEHWWVVLPLFLAGAVVWLLLHLLFGREPAIAEAPEYLVEPPHPWRPCQVSYLLRWGDVAQAEFVATALDLLRRGALQVVVSHAPAPGEHLRAKDFALRRALARAGKMLPSERHFVEKLLFQGAGGDVYSLGVLRERIGHQSHYQYGRYREWRQLVVADCRAEPAFGTLRVSGLALARTAGAGLVVAAAFLGLRYHAPSALLAALLGIAMGAARPLVCSHTPEGALVVRQWQAYRRFLADPADPDLPGLDLSRSECSLAYAMVLGVEKATRTKLARYGERTVPAGEGEDGFAQWHFLEGRETRDMATLLRAHDDLCEALWRVADFQVKVAEYAAYD